MDAKQLPARPSLEQYRKQAKELLQAQNTPAALARFKKFHPRLTKLTPTEIAATKLSLADAQCVIAREHAFESWPKFGKHIEDLERADSPVSRFESAADAIATGDVATLKRLLREEPQLIRARSTREHGAPLIHYVAANGVENFRQKTPLNIVEITKVLLAAGAEVDATTQAYGGASSVLGLTATSHHPAKAGVMSDLLQTLLAAGANINGAPGGWNALIAALHNGRGGAAEFLAAHGAQLDLEGAAGVGRVEVVADFVTADGKPKNGATQEQLNHGFIWACEYGHANVVRFLLERGYQPDGNFMCSQSGLHWAGFGGHTEIVELLLKAKLPLHVKDQVHHGTPLEWAVYGWNDPAPEFKNSRHYEAIELLVHAGAPLDWGWIDGPRGDSAFGAKVRADARLMAILPPPPK